MHSWRIGFGLLLYLYLYLIWSEQKQRAKKPTVFYPGLEVHPEVGVEFPLISLHLSLPFLSLSSPYRRSSLPPKITLPKRKRILSYLFNGLIFEQRIHQSFLSIHAYEED